MFKGNREFKRVPVKYKDTPLMPMLWKRVRKLIKQKKAVLVVDKLLGVYVKLKYKPKTLNTQNIVLGIDPGTCFDGFTILSREDNRNLQYNHQLPLSGSLKSIMDKRIMYRRLRRVRLRHRKCRNDTRVGKKITNTSNYYFQNRIEMIKRITNLYPIQKVIIEDVRFNHYRNRNGKSFSNIEVGKNRLYNYITNNLGLILEKQSGYNTSVLRSILFPYNKKNKDKNIKDFYSHCVDSCTLAIIGHDNGNINSYHLIKSINDKFNKVTRFIERNTYKYRRELHRLKNRIKDSRFYFRYKKGGIKEKIEKYSKLKKIRVKVDDSKSNHGPWNYLYTVPEPCYKKFVTNYGGTISLSSGISKYWNGKNYIYYSYTIN